MKNELIKQYENKELKDDGVNEIFSSQDQIDKSQYPLYLKCCRGLREVSPLYKLEPVPVAPTTNPPGTPTNTIPPAANDNVNNLL